ncbi:hypothetical protein OLK001_26660 [Synechocystis sp. LKSZ1]
MSTHFVLEDGFRPMGHWDEEEDGNVIWFFPENPWPQRFYYGSPYDDDFPIGHAVWCPGKVPSEGQP